MADIFAVIADPTRRDLLSALRGDDPETVVTEPPVMERSVGELVAHLGLSQPTVSKHLRILRESGLVHVREEGQHRYYSVDSGPLAAIEAWIATFFPEPVVEIQGEVVPLRSVGVVMPAPLRRAAENLPDVGDVGATLGRAVAGARSRILEPAKKRLGHREQG